MRRTPLSKSACPACGHALVGIERRGVEIDFCATCLGTWLDAAEVDALGDGAARTLGAASRQPAGSLSERLCPRCRKRLRVEAIRIASGTIEVDICAAGCGVFLDAGELAQIAPSDAPWKSEFFSAVDSLQGGS